MGGCPHGFDRGRGGCAAAVRDMPIIPGPVQRPRPPITVAGVGEKYTLPLVARYADVWNVPTYALGELERKVSVLRSICEDIGRDPATIVCQSKPSWLWHPMTRHCRRSGRSPSDDSVGLGSACTTAASLAHRRSSWSG